MLYISRIVSSESEEWKNETKYGVVDTDDGVETLVCREELDEIVIHYQLVVEGTSVLHDSGIPVVADVIPWQAPETYTARQVKAQTLLGVEVRTYGDEVSAIIIDERVMKDGVRIRLSEFGKKMSGGCKLMFTNPTLYERRIIFILDDNIRVYGNFMLYLIDGVYFDVSEVTDDQYLWKLRQYYVQEFGDAWPWSEYVIDDKHRFVE